jgi:hypothetical protein
MTSSLKIAPPGRSTRRGETLTHQTITVKPTTPVIGAEANWLKAKENYRRLKDAGKI